MANRRAQGGNRLIGSSGRGRVTSKPKAQVPAIPFRPQISLKTMQECSQPKGVKFETPWETPCFIFVRSFYFCDFERNKLFTIPTDDEVFKLAF